MFEECVVDLFLRCATSLLLLSLLLLFFLQRVRRPKEPTDEKKAQETAQTLHDGRRCIYYLRIIQNLYKINILNP